MGQFFAKGRHEFGNYVVGDGACGHSYGIGTNGIGTEMNRKSFLGKHGETCVVHQFALFTPKLYVALLFVCKILRSEVIVNHGIENLQTVGRKKGLPT